jgi:hypothetical protein
MKAMREAQSEAMEVNQRESKANQGKIEAIAEHQKSLMKRQQWSIWEHWTTNLRTSNRP